MHEPVFVVIATHHVNVVRTLLQISPKQVKVKFGSGETQAVVFFKELKG